MTEPFSDELTFSEGFWSNTALIGSDRPVSSLTDGKNMWYEGPGRLRSWGGSNLISGGLGNVIAGLLGTKIYTTNQGSATLYRNGAIFFTGSTLNIGTVSGTTGTFVTLAGQPNKLNVALSETGTVFQAGLTAPTNVLLSTGNTAATKIQPGTYSVKATVVRTETNAESNGSPVSNFYVADGTKKIAVNVTVNVNGALGSFKIRLYASEKNLQEGPWGFLGEYPISAFPMEIDFVGGDLNFDLQPPLDNDPPIDGATHVFSLGAYIITLGILGGGGVQFSKRGRPEAFPPDFVTFLNPNEAVLGIRGRPATGWQYVFCRNSLHSIYLTGDDDIPVAVNSIWSETGISNANAASFVGGEFYGFSGKKGLVRTTAGSQSAEPDSSFGLAVENITDTWDPTRVVVGYSQDTDSVAYFHQNTCLQYMRKLGKWSLPFNLPDGSINNPVTSAVTYQGRLYAIATAAMYEFGQGTQPVPWFAIPAWRDGGANAWYKTITGVRTVFDFGSSTTAQYKGEILTNFDTTAVKKSQTTTATGKPLYTNWIKCNVKKAYSYTVRHSGTGGNQYIYSTVVQGGISKVRV